MKAPRSRLGAGDAVIRLFILTAALSLIGILDLAREAGQPFGGYISYRRTPVRTAEIDANTPTWWPGMINGRLRIGMTLLQADGRPYYPDVRDVFRDAAAEGRPTVEVSFLNRVGDGPFSRDLPVLTFTAADFLDVRLPDLIMAVVFWGLALVVYGSAPDNPTNRSFAAAAALMGLLRAVYVHTLFLDDALSVAVELVLLATVPALGVAILNFALRFPALTARSGRGLLWAAGAAAVVVAAGAALPWVAGSALPAAVAHRAASLGYYGGVVLVLLGLAVLAARLIWRLAHYRRLSRRERRILVILLVGLAFAAPMVVVSALNTVTVGGRHLSYYVRGLDMRYLTLGFPLAFGYVLIRYRALRSPSPLFLGFIALSFSAIVGALGTVVWAWGHPAWPMDGQRPPFLPVFVAALVSSLLWGRATSWQGVFGRLLHHDRRAAAAARGFGRRVTAQTDLKALPDTIGRALMEEFDLERAAVWLRPPGGDALDLASHGGDFPAPLPPHLPAGAPGANQEPVRLNAVAGVPAWLAPLTGGQGLDVALPLIADGAVIGLVAAGPRWDEEIFDERDLEIAELLGQQATLFLTAAAGVAELRRVPGRMADVQDRERQRLAQELHDTVQQFLGRLPFYLAVGRDAAAARPEVTRDILERAIADVEDAATTLRQIRHNLAPSQLNRGLLPAVAALCRHFQDRTGIQTTLVADGIDTYAGVDARHTLYRVIQQALDNVETHAEASQVAVNLAAESHRLSFAVRDNGRGSTAAERESARAAGSFGLESMRARVEAGGGEFRLWSAPGKGTEVKGWLPTAGGPQDGQNTYFL